MHARVCVHVCVDMQWDTITGSENGKKVNAC